jgi:hypothetical protein
MNAKIATRLGMLLPLSKFVLAVFASLALFVMTS